MRKIYIALSLLVTAMMILTACGPKAPAGPATPKDPTTFVTVAFGEAETLDPALDYESAGIGVIQNIYEGLIFYNREKPAEFVPLLATAMPTISEDGLTITFTIRQGIKFHEGGDLTPSDIAYSFQRGVLQGGTSSPQWLLTEPFWGVGTDDVAMVVADKISALVATKTDEIVAGLDLAAVTAPAAEEGGTLPGVALITQAVVDLAAYYTQISGFAVDAATAMAAPEAVTAVNELIATPGLDAAAITTYLSDTFSGMDGADPYALYDDQEAMKAVDPAILKEVGEEVQGFIVADDTNWTVTFNLKQPWGPFIATIANAWGSAMDQQWVVEKGGWDGSAETWQNYYATTSDVDTFTDIANGTGPFKLDHWTKGQELVLVRNDNYWLTTPLWAGGPTGPAALQRVVLKSVNEWGTRFAMLQAGDADFATVNRQDVSQVDPLLGEKCVWNDANAAFDACAPVGDGSGALRLYIGHPTTTTHTDVFFNFNISNPGGSNPYMGSGKLDGNGIPSDFFSDVHIRKAFNYCFDWDTFIQDALVGEAVQTLDIAPPGMPGYDANSLHYSFDAAKCAEEFQASTLRSEDGKTVWDVGFRFQALYNTGNTTRQTVAEILAADLASVNPLFTVEILGVPWPTFLRAQRAKTLPLFISGWIEDIHDPHNWYQPYLVGTYGRRQSIPSDMAAAYQTLLNQGVSEVDPAKRAVIYAQVNQMQYDNPSLILLAIATGRHYEQRWVKGWYYNPIYGDVYYYPLSK